MGGNFAFDLRHACERLVPARLQFASHQPIGRIGGIILPEGAIGCIARRFEIALERFAHLIPRWPASVSAATAAAMAPGSLR